MQLNINKHEYLEENDTHNLRDLIINKHKLLTDENDKHFLKQLKH